MRIENHRLVDDSGRAAAFVPAARQGGEINPRFVVMHYTAGGEAAGTMEYFASPAARASAHFVVGRDGAITQQVACDRAAWHAGRSRWQSLYGLNNHSVGIELANWGRLLRTPSGYASHTGGPVDPSRVVLAVHRNKPGEECGWERYPHPQIAAAADLAAALLVAYGLGEDAIIGHDDIAPERKIDPGPAFEMRAFRGRAAGRGCNCAAGSALRVVTGASGLNLRLGPGLAHAAIALMPHGAPVRLVFPDGPWPEAPWLFVSLQEDGADGVTGYAHSAWLAAVEG